MEFNNLAFDQRSKKTLFIIDDDPIVYDALVALLCDTYFLYIAIDIKSTFKLFKEVTPDLILCDLKLPDGCGLDIIQELKSSDEYSHIPIIIISGFNSESAITKGLLFGANDYIKKPWSNNELLHRIDSQLKNRQRVVDWCRNNTVVPTLANSEFSESLLSKSEIFVEKLQHVVGLLVGKNSLSIDHLASEMAHSKRQLQRKVKQYLNCSCSEYILKIRMNYAQELNGKGYSAKEISAKIGYKDTAHFNQVFKKFLSDKVKPDNVQSSKENYEY
ncbi:MAG: response regulator [Colwellia sp.]|nr:response regulator [Colwellia sp.]